MPNWRENADQSALARFPPLNYRLIGCFQGSASRRTAEKAASRRYIIY